MRLEMSHYSLEEWTDFVRGRFHPSRHGEMQRHLKECLDCRRAASILREAATLSSFERDFEPPSHLVELAEKIFSPVPPAMVEHLGARLRRLAARLEWDSFGGEALQGVRAVRSGARHVVYRAGRYSIDVILESDLESGAVVLTAQVSDEAQPSLLPGVLKPILLVGREVISTTASTESGEFSLQYGQGRDVSLWIPMEQTGEIIELSLLPRAGSN